MAQCAPSPKAEKMPHPTFRLSALAALVATLQPTTQLSLASGLTLAEGRCRTQAVAAWRRLPELHGGKLPAVFCWLATG